MRLKWTIFVKQGPHPSPVNKQSVIIHYLIHNGPTTFVEEDLGGRRGRAINLIERYAYNNLQYHPSNQAPGMNGVRWRFPNEGDEEEAGRAGKQGGGWVMKRAIAGAIFIATTPDHLRSGLRDSPAAHEIYSQWAAMTPSISPPRRRGRFTSSRRSSIRSTRYLTSSIHILHLGNPRGRVMSYGVVSFCGYCAFVASGFCV